MKNIALFLFFLFSVSISYANAIDSIKTNQDLIFFLSKNFHSTFKDAKELFHNDSEMVMKGLENEYRSNTFYKADIDQNGLTDIFVDGASSFIILNKGNKYDLIFVDGSDRSVKYSFNKFLLLRDKPLLILLNEYCLSYNMFDEKKVAKIDTIVYKFGGIIEYNSHPVKYKVSDITFATSGCFGPCPIYTVEILKDRLAYYNAEGYNNTNGSFYGKIEQKRLDSLLDIVGYIKIATLRDDYNVTGTDHQAGRIKISFDDGSLKEIKDYGMIGTFGLRRLYSLFNQYRYLEGWVQWNEASLSSKIDSYLILFPGSFNYGNTRYGERDLFQYTMSKTIDSSNTKRDKIEMYKTETEGGYLSFYPDSMFTFTYDTKNKEVKNRFSIGKWSQIADSSIVLNWNGKMTLNTCSEKRLFAKYVNFVSNPEPMRIENWKFSFSRDRNELIPIFKD